MNQPWIHKAKTDLIFIVMPPFFVLALIFLFQGYISKIQEQYSFYTWLFLIVFIDVAHVYATLFKTYFLGSEFKKRKKLLLTLPILCFVIGFLLFQFGSTIFWSFLAYVAVFHFIRQQYGFVRLYARNETKTKFNRNFDALIIYTATIYPMLYWFFSPKRNFNWFVENEFFKYENPFLIKIFTALYFIIIAIYVVRTIVVYYKKNYFNFPKNLIIIGTILSWYFGIVYYNNDLVFTLLNVVSHGIPYIALVYLKEIDLKPNNELGYLFYFKKYKGFLAFILVLLLFAFSEEYFWEVSVWQEHFNGNLLIKDWQFILVPLLTVPQFIHYLLDGFIWKNNKSS